MYSVGLIECCDSPYPFKKKWHQGGTVLSSKLGIDCSELLAIPEAIIWRDLHSQEHQLRSRAEAASSLEYPFDVCAKRIGRETTQTVVRTSLDHEHRHGTLKQPINAVPGSC